MTPTQTDAPTRYLVLSLVTVTDETAFREDFVPTESGDLADIIGRRAPALLSGGWVSGMTTATHGAVSVTFPPAEGSSQSEHDTSKMVAETLRAVLVAIGVTRTEDALLGPQDTHDGGTQYHLIGGETPTGVPLSISVNVTP